MCSPWAVHMQLNAHRLTTVGYRFWRNCRLALQSSPVNRLGQPSEDVWKYSLLPEYNVRPSSRAFEVQVMRAMRRAEPRNNKNTSKNMSAGTNEGKVYDLLVKSGEAANPEVQVPVARNTRRTSSSSLVTRGPRHGTELEVLQLHYALSQFKV